jgi:hypothetical protein
MQAEGRVRVSDSNRYFSVGQSKGKGVGNSFQAQCAIGRFCMRRPTVVAKLIPPYQVVAQQPAAPVPPFSLGPKYARYAIQEHLDQEMRRE